MQAASVRAQGLGKAPMSLLSACKDFFGTKEGQTSIEFGKEYKLLTTDDRAQMREMLQSQQGYTINELPQVALVPIPA